MCEEYDIAPEVLFTRWNSRLVVSARGDFYARALSMHKPIVRYDSFTGEKMNLGGEPLFSVSKLERLLGQDRTTIIRSAHLRRYYDGMDTELPKWISARLPKNGFVDASFVRKLRATRTEPQLYRDGWYILKSTPRFSETRLPNVKTA